MSTIATTNLKNPSSASNNIVLDSSARVLVGTSTARANPLNPAAILQVEANDTSASILISRNSANSVPPRIAFLKTRGTSTGANTLVSINDSIGEILFAGADGTAGKSGAAITAEVDGTPGADDMPGRLVFSTTADGAATPSPRMTIKADGSVGIATDAPGKTLTVLGDIWSGGGAGSLSTGTARNITVAVNRTAGADVFPSITLNKGYTASSATVGGFKIEQSGTHLAPALTFSYGTSVGNTASTFVEPSWTEGLRITSTGQLRLAGAGITFNGDTATANELDDYEEGTFTLSLADAATGGNVSATTNTALYTKIGNVVIVCGSLFNINTSGLTAGNVGYFRGLPFTSGSQNATAAVTLEQVTFSGFVSAYVPANTTYFYLAQSSSAANDVPLTVAALASGTADLNGFTLVYRV